MLLSTYKLTSQQKSSSIQIQIATSVQRSIKLLHLDRFDRSFGMALRFRHRFSEEEEEEEDGVRPDKPRCYGVTNIRAPSFASHNLAMLQEVLEGCEQFVDGLTLEGFSLLPKNSVKEITDIAHRFNISVGTGDWFEDLSFNSIAAFHNYVQACKDLGFDSIDINTKLLKVPEQTILQLIRIIKNAELKAKPQLGIWFERSAIPSKENRSFGAYVVPTPSQPGLIEDVDLLIRRAERCLEAGADMILIDADGLSDHAEALRTDAIAKIIGRLGLQKTMFHADCPETFNWFVRAYGARVNLFVDHSHVNKLECTRNGALGFDPMSLFQRKFSSVMF